MTLQSNKKKNHIAWIQLMMKIRYYIFIIFPFNITFLANEELTNVSFVKTMQFITQYYLLNIEKS